MDGDRICHTDPACNVLTMKNSFAMKKNLARPSVYGYLFLICLFMKFGGGLSYAQNTLEDRRSSEIDKKASVAHSVTDIQGSLSLRSGYTMQAIATEPLIADPVTARLDSDGRLWVVEMPDYPMGPADGKPPSGRIKILADKDHDGVFDHATVFASGLLFATGIQPYRDGAFVTLAGKIIFLRDRDHDGQADETVVLFEGFAEQNEQLRANHPTLGPDGLVYVAGGLRGGSIKAVDPRYDARTAPVDLRDRDFCFDPEGGWWGSVPGKSQFGVSIDDFGRRFGCSNRNPAMMPILTLDAVQRDPLLVGRDAIHDVALAAENSKVVSKGQSWTTSNLHSGQFSAACGVFAPGWYQDGEEWLLACEPTAYVVQRQRLSREGSVWKSRREEEEHEFISSEDSWFRPVDITAGPGNSVFIVDMARAVIEHPDFMPIELKSRPDQRDGTSLGRIWRVARESEIAVPSRMETIDDAIRWLQAESAWQRASASQYLLESNKSVIKPLSELLLDEEVVTAARSRAAWLLKRHGSLNQNQVESMLQSSDARLRALGVQLSRGIPGLLKVVLSLADDADPLVARTVAVEAGAGADFLPLRLKALVTIGRQWSGTDHWIRQTVVSADQHVMEQFAGQLAKWERPDLKVVQHLVERMAVGSPQEAIAVVLADTESEAHTPSLSRREVELLKAWVRGLRKSRQSVSKVVADLQEPLQAGLQNLISKMLVTAKGIGNQADLRAAGLMLAADFGQVKSPLRDLVSDDVPADVQAVAMPLNLRIDPDWTRALLNQKLMGMTMMVRSAAISACLRRSDDAKWFLQQIETGQIPKTVVDPGTGKKFRQHPDAEVKALASRLFATDPDRAKILASYAESAKELGDARSGKSLFKQHCAACHQIDGVGTNVGPDISDSRTKTPAALLTSILDPNAAIDSAFMQHQVLTVDGRVLDGLLIGEANDAVILQQKEGKRITIQRKDIETLQAPGTSLMPEGFEQILDQEKMSDLLSYLKNWRYLDGSIPGRIPGRD